jgi:hypothetical protein
MVDAGYGYLDPQIVAMAMGKSRFWDLMYIYIIMYYLQLYHTISYYVNSDPTFHRRGGLFQY